MTKVRKVAKAIIEHLHAADKELCIAKRLAGDSDMGLVVNDIHESQWMLDEAIAHVDGGLNKFKKSLSRGLTSAKDGL